jgi:electron transport complex protein RnfB
MNISPQQWLQTAVIREKECVGCTKCIQACPYDAIIGANKLMHTVLNDICTGCGLCVPACPFDCIDLVPTPVKNTEAQKKFELDSQSRKTRRAERIAHDQCEDGSNAGFVQETLEQRKTVIWEAIARSKNKQKTSGPLT